MMFIITFIFWGLKQHKKEEIITKISSAFEQPLKDKEIDTSLTYI